jgi:hypothetical protein
MYFEIIEFLETLNGLSKEQVYQMISIQQDILMHYVSQPKTKNGQIVELRSFRVEIDFLNKLGLEVGSGFVTPSTFIDRYRIDRVLKNLSIKE